MTSTRRHYHLRPARHRHGAWVVRVAIVLVGMAAIGGASTVGAQQTDGESAMMVAGDGALTLDAARTQWAGLSLRQRQNAFERWRLLSQLTDDERARVIQNFRLMRAWSHRLSDREDAVSEWFRRRQGSAGGPRAAEGALAEGLQHFALDLDAVRRERLRTLDRDIRHYDAAAHQQIVDLPPAQHAAAIELWRVERLRKYVDSLGDELDLSDAEREGMVAIMDEARRKQDDLYRQVRDRFTQLEDIELTQLVELFGSEAAALRVLNAVEQRRRHSHSGWERRADDGDRENGTRWGNGRSPSGDGLAPSGDAGSGSGDHAQRRVGSWDQWAVTARDFDATGEAALDQLRAIYDTLTDRIGQVFSDAMANRQRPDPAEILGLLQRARRAIVAAAPGGDAQRAEQLAEALLGGAIEDARARAESNGGQGPRGGTRRRGGGQRGNGPRGGG